MNEKVKIMKYGIVMRNRISSVSLIVNAVVFLSLFACGAPEANAEPEKGAVRVLFLGHESEHHNSNKFYPMLAKGLGRDAIYFDYVTTVEGALGDASYLNQFDALLSSNLLRESLAGCI